jgi:hypothetical protein
MFPSPHRTLKKYVITGFMFLTEKAGNIIKLSSFISVDSSKKFIIDKIWVTGGISGLRTGV